MNEKIKRITGRYILPSLLIMLSLCILFVPAAGSDEADSTTDSDVTSYGIWVGGTEITSENTEIYGRYGGAALFDEETKTLTLQDYNFEADGIGIESTENLTLNIRGKNNIKSISHGINAPGLTIKGNGTLNIVSETIGIKIGPDGSGGAKITGESEGSRLTVDIQAGQGGIHVNGGSLDLKYCDITIKGKGSSPSGNGIYVFTPGTPKQCTINQCTVVLKNNNGMDLYGKLSVKKSLIEIESLGNGIFGSYVSPEIEDSIVAIEADSDGINTAGGSASNPNFGDVTLVNSDLVIKYGRYAATTYLTLIIEGNSSVVMECDDAHATSSSRLIGNYKDLTVEIKMNDYVFEHNNNEGVMERYSKEELTSTSKFGYESKNDYDYYDIEQPNYQSFGIRPKLTVSFNGSGMDGSMDQISAVKGEVVELPSESQFIYTGVGTFVGWEDDGKQFYPAGHVIILTSDMVLTPVYDEDELEIISLNVEVVGEFFIGDTLEDSDLRVEATYSNGVNVRLHISSLEIENFTFDEYKENATAKVKYGEHEAVFEYSVNKLKQSTGDYTTLFRISGPDREIDLGAYFDSLYNSYRYFGSVYSPENEPESDEGILRIVLTKGTAEFDYDESKMKIYNVTKAGTFTLTLTRTGNETFDDLTETYECTIQKSDIAKGFINADPGSPEFGNTVNITLFGFIDGEITITIDEGGTADALVYENTVSITDRGEDGTVNLEITVTGSSLYNDSSTTYELIFGKADGNKEVGYTEPGTVELEDGQSITDIGLPERWRWASTDVNLKPGENHVEAVYTPLDSNNYEEYKTDVTVLVGLASSTIELLEDDFTYTEGMEIDFTKLIDGNGNGEVTYSVSNKEGVEFEFTNGTVSNITMAGGTFTLTVSKAETEDYAACEESFVITLNKGIQTLAVTGSGDPTYGEAYTVSVDGNIGTLSYSVNEADGRFDGYILTANRAGTINYTVTAAATDLYEEIVEEYEVEFSKASLQVTVMNQIVIYGEESQEFSVNVTGLVGEDDPEDITGELVFVCSYSAGDDCGEYPVCVSGVQLHDNYDIAYGEGTLFVIKKDITVIASPAESEYGQDIVEIESEILYNTLDEIQGIYILTTTATKESPPGEYDIGIEVLNENYHAVLQDNGSKYTITKATVDVPVINDVEFTGDTVKAVIDESDIWRVIENDGGVNTGQYDVVLELTNPEYYRWSGSEGSEVTISYNVVSAKNSWLIEPTIADWTYGGVRGVPHFEAEYGTQTASVTYRSGDGIIAEPPTDAGAYFLIVEIPATDEYSGISMEVEFEIGKADPNPGELPSFYHPYGVSINDLVFTGHERWTWIHPGSDVLGVGEHDVDARYTPEDQLNYNVYETKIKVVITKKVLTVTVLPLEIKYGEVPEFKLMYDGFENGDDESVLDTSDKSYSGYDVNNPVGEYPVVVSGIISDNYIIPDASGTLTVVPAIPDIRDPPTAVQSLVYNGEEQNLISPGVVNGGVMKYSLNGEEWSESIPTGVDAGSYTVYYMVYGNENYEDVTDYNFRITVVISSCAHTECNVSWDNAGHWEVCECGHETDPEPHFGGTATCQSKAECEICGTEYGNFGEHSVSTSWTTENGIHFHECTVDGCTHTEDSTACSGGTATCEDRAICSTCGQQYGELADHSYDNACDSSCNVCGSSRSVGSHQYGSDNTCDECGHVRYVAPVTPSVPSHTHHYSDACDTTCNGCSHVRAVSHTFGTEWAHGDHHHWMECEDCGHQSQLAEHVYSTDVEDTQCNVCGHDWKIHHTFEVLHMDDEGHWHECAHDECIETANFMEHTPSDPHPETGTIVCIDCGHDLTNVSSSVDDGDGGNNMAVIIAAIVGVVAVLGAGAFFLLRGKP